MAFGQTAICAPAKASSRSGGTKLNGDQQLPADDRRRGLLCQVERPDTSSWSKHAIAPLGAAASSLIEK